MEELKTRFLAAKRKLFDTYYGAFLNPEQCRAVFTAKGPLLVLAGAGSGKTTVLVNRIAYLIKYGNAYYDETLPEGISAGMVEALEEASQYDREEIGELLPSFIAEACPPWQVLAFTFTNKAAGEIRERLDSTFNDKSVSDAIWAGTFHSICVRILRKYGDRLGYRDGFSIYDTDDKKRLITDCMKEFSIDEKNLNPKAVANEISMAKDALVDVAHYGDPHDPRCDDVRKIYALYQQKLIDYNALDFDDIIMKTVELLQSDEEARSYYQRKFRYVLVDEYQDTNYAQFALTKLLSDGSRNLMVVGDDDQSIYRFRGATIENILNFDKTYPDATVVKLEQNYRSTETILAAANAVISHNEDRHAKKLWCDKGTGAKITLRECANQEDEGRYILGRITRACAQEGRKYSDHAVLYRVNEMGRSLETTFAKSGVPCRIIGGQRFYDRKEIRDMVAYLIVLSSPFDDLRLKRIVNEPKRKIGAAAIEAVEQIANETGRSMYDVMAHANDYLYLAKCADKLLAFVAMMEGMKTEDRLPSALVAEIFERTGYREMLESEGFEGKSKIANVEELISGALEYEKRCGEAGVEPTLSGYLEEIALVSDIDKYDENADTVVLMTVHAAKGLEFPVVFLAGMEDGIFPSTMNFGQEDEMSEERRLAYVAITRAKEKLYITHARERVMYKRTSYNKLSRFIAEEVPMNLIESEKSQKEPPRARFYSDTPRQNQQNLQNQQRELLREFTRPVNLGGTAQKAGPKAYGVEKFPIGTRVRHAMFGEGVILDAKDMGGDVLYNVRFADGSVKKLMATFAKLEKI